MRPAASVAQRCAEREGCSRRVPQLRLPAVAEEGRCILPEDTSGSSGDGRHGVSL